jgi:hypothetical protein
MNKSTFYHQVSKLTNSCLGLLILPMFRILVTGCSSEPTAPEESVAFVAVSPNKTSIRRRKKCPSSISSQNEEMVLKPKNPAVGIEEFHEKNRNKAKSTWRGFFVHDWYDNSRPQRPPYLDIALKDGLKMTSPSFQAGFPVPTVQVNDRVEAEFTVRNYGDYPAKVSQLYLYVRDPAGRNVDALLGGGDNNATPLKPGEERRIHRICQNFGPHLGRYTIGVSYLSKQRHWITIPRGEAGTRSQLNIDLRPPRQQVLIVDKWITVRERDREVDTGINIQPGDDYAFRATGQIWAGVWGTGTNGPRGWNNVDHDPKFPLHKGPDAHPFCLIGKLGRNGEYFYIGDERARAKYAGRATQRLFLRTNDDAPGNGSGAFNCRVVVWR